LLTALRIVDVPLFLALVGPLVGARLANLRAPPPSGTSGGGTGGSAVIALALGLMALLRRAS
jgi:hypothetical protein